MKKVIIWSLVTVLMISLMSGCTKKEENLQDDLAATGRYLEEEIVLPQEGIVLDIQVLENNVIGNVMTNGEGTMSLWSTADYGQTWEKEYDILLEEGEYAGSAALLKDGTVLATSSWQGDSEMEINEALWKIDTQGNREEIEIELPEIEFGDDFSSHRMEVSEDEIVVDGDTNMATGEVDTTTEESAVVNQVVTNRTDEGDEEEYSIIMSDNMKDAIMEIQVSEQGRVVVYTMMGKTMQIDIETGEILKEYALPEDVSLMEIIIANEDLYIQTSMGLQRYDIETGERQEVSEALIEKMSMDMAAATLYLGGTSIAMASKAGEENGSIYMADSTGIYRQGEDGTVLEQVVDGARTSLSTPNTLVQVMLALEDDSFLVCSGNAETWENKLYRYVYYADAKTTPEVEVQMYALEDNREIRQAIAMYRKENPDTVISLQIGMTGEDGITISDALNALNTEIMAGNGPDILLLDGMPIASYIEKGILEDISDVVNKVDEQYGILKTGENTHAVATRFSVPYVQGEAKYVDSIEDIVTLQETLKEAKSEYPDRQSMYGEDIEQLMQYLYQIYVNSFITQEGEIEKEKLQTFLQQAKEIAETNYGKEDSDVEWEGDVAGARVGLVTTTIGTAIGTATGIDAASDVAMQLLAKEASIGRGAVKTQTDLAVILETNSKMDITHKVVTADEGETLLLTNTILGINSKGEQIEKAKEILEFCLSKEVQVSEQGMGLPVNKEALGETLRKEMELGFAQLTQTEDGVSDVIEMTVSTPEESDVEKFEQNILGDVRIGYSNRVVQEIVVEQLMGYIDGRVTLDEVITGIDQRVSLYLAE